MILPGHVISEFVEQGMISVEPAFDPQQLRPFGLRVHLSPAVLVPGAGQRVDLTVPSTEPPTFERVDLDQQPLTLQPGKFVLASTVESFLLSPTLVCRLDGRSTIARLGILVHCTASVIDGNLREHRTIVLELANIGPFEVVLPAGIGIGTVVFEQVAGEAQVTLEQDQYKGQRSVAPPNLQFEIPRYSGLGDE